MGQQEVNGECAQVHKPPICLVSLQFVGKDIIANLDGEETVNEFGNKKYHVKKIISIEVAPEKKPDVE